RPWYLPKLFQGQLKHLLQFPIEKASEEAYAVYDRACLDVMIHTGLSDCLGNAPDRKNGLHVAILQKKLDIDSRKITIILRYLCTQGWVRETKEGVFALNRPGYELLQGTQGWKRLRTPYAPEIAGTLVKWLQHPEWKYSDSAVHTSLQMVHNMDLPLFDWALGDTYIGGTLADYPWKSLEGRRIIDCGGGTGTLSIELAKTFPSLQFIIQDLPEALSIAKSQIQNALPQAEEEGRIVTEFQDFFQPQCRRGDSYHYLFRHILYVGYIFPPRMSSECFADMTGQTKLRCVDLVHPDYINSDWNHPNRQIS
ncbi:hypothetical protein PHLCEN_2v13306, partial [Hermanssonia centrifuga]